MNKKLYTLKSIIRLSAITFVMLICLTQTSKAQQLGYWSLNGTVNATSSTPGVTAQNVYGQLSTTGFAGGGMWAGMPSSTSIDINNFYWEYDIATDASTTAIVTGIDLYRKEAGGSGSTAIYTSLNGGTFTQRGSNYTVGGSYANAALTGLNLTVPPNSTFHVRFITWNSASNGSVYNKTVSINGYVPPVITSFVPATACENDTITITGTNLSNATSVTIGGTPVASIVSNTATQIVALVGPGTSGTIDVTTGGHTGTSTGTVTVNTIPAQPTLITGLASICANTVNTYSIAPVSGATSYTWALPLGWSGFSLYDSISATADTSSGTMYVIASNSCGSGNPASLIISNSSCSTVGIAANDINTDIKIYPNPFKENATLRLGKDVSLSGAGIVIYDVLGKTVRVIANIHSYEIKIERNNLPEGLYFYKFTNGAQTTTGKLIIE